MSIDKSNTEAMQGPLFDQESNLGVLSQRNARQSIKVSDCLSTVAERAK